MIVLGALAWLMRDAGDVAYTVRNDTTHTVLFYLEGRVAGAGPGLQLDPGEALGFRAAVGTYAVGATDTTGSWLFCRTLTADDLRAAQFLIAVKDDPMSCR